MNRRPRHHPFLWFAGGLAVALAVVLAPAILRAAAAAGGSRTIANLAVRHAVMIRFPETITPIGDNAAPHDERPEFRMKIEGFLLDRTPVTVAQFRTFVEQTNYITDAERKGGGFVMQYGAGDWVLLPDATWRRPTGSEGPAAGDDLPVTQVSWNDARAFCSAYGARLPSEFEWERAARLGQTPDGTVFSASNIAASIEAKLHANTWQGVYPVLDTGEDGYRGASPVGAFGEAPSGLTDMAGNV